MVIGSFSAFTECRDGSASTGKIGYSNSNVTAQVPREIATTAKPIQSR
jgi:hypothetical protein